MSCTSHRRRSIGMAPRPTLRSPISPCPRRGVRPRRWSHDSIAFAGGDRSAAFATVITAIRCVYVLGAVGVVSLGVTWMAYNASVMPAYGDTIDYLERARTLQVDQYRT